MKTNRKKWIWMVGAVLLAGFIAGMAGCAASGGPAAGGSGSLTTYAGSDPKGDYIVIEFDTAASQVRRINFTTGETNGWFSYTTLPYTSPYANGFTVVKRATIASNATTNFFALFTEFPQAACVYLLMMETNGAPGFVVENPAYVVYRQTLSGSDLYGRAYNWMKFTIEDAATNSDMEVGFAAYDTSGSGGKMYGAGYSQKQQTGQGLSNCGFHDIDETDAMYVTNFTANSAAGSLTMWAGTVGDWSRAISMTGTPSGTVILDFGTNAGGGSGIAIPQSSLATNPTAWWSTVGGTYFAVIYEFDKSTGETSIKPIKINVSAGGRVKVYDFTNRIADTPFFNELMIMISNATTNQSPCTNYTPSELMAHFSGNASASSGVVRDAEYGLGSYIFVSPTITLFTMFDPEGRFLSFDMYDNMGGGANYAIRFGFGIRDASYNDGF